MIRVEVNGEGFTRFKQIDITDSLDDFSVSAGLIVTEPYNNEEFLKVGDKISILLDGIKIITGYAEKLTDAESNGSHDISYSVRSLVADIIDSSAPDALKFLEGVSTFKDLVQKAIDGLGLEIDVIDNVNVGFSGEIKAAAVGQNCLAFLQEYARKAQVFLNTDGLGNVFIRQPGGDLKTHIVTGVNILDSSINLDDSKRFNKYIVYSNSNVSAEGNTDNLNVSGEAIDSSIRSTRLFEKIAEKPMTAKECANAAIEEANIRRIRAFQYSVKVAGFSANDELWQPGKLGNINDYKKGVKGKYVIKSCAYNYSDGGEFTTMTCTLPDAYKLEAELSVSDSKTITQPYKE